MVADNPRWPHRGLIVPPMMSPLLIPSRITVLRMSLLHGSWFGYCQHDSASFTARGFEPPQWARSKGTSFGRPIVYTPVKKYVTVLSESPIKEWSKLALNPGYHREWIRWETSGQEAIATMETTTWIGFCIQSFNGNSHLIQGLPSPPLSLYSFLLKEVYVCNPHRANH